MVYRGKPSLGCKKCRQRKIKCDERPGGCVKCEDKGFTCPGYDNPLDRFFQDESAAVKVKADRAKAKAILAREERDRTRIKSTSPSGQCTVRNPLHLPLLDQGIAYFMTNYAVGLEQPPVQSESYNQHLSTFGFHPLIATSMTALGLAGIGNLSRDPSLKQEAMRWYTKALNLTNKALATPSEVKADTTLFATLLLSVFETTSNDHTLLGWVNHVEGSASLLRMRGKKQFSTPAGRRMYLQTVGMLTIKCIGGGEHIPDFIHKLNDEVDKWEDKDDPGNRFYHMHIAVCELRAAILSAEITSLHTILERALQVDDQAKRIFDNTDREWAFHVEHCPEGTPGVFGTYYHVYPSLVAAQIWNWFYYNRIFLLDIIRNSLIAGLSATPPIFVGNYYLTLLQDATADLYKMQADILASMPQHMHDVPKIPPSATRSTPATLDVPQHTSYSPPTTSTPYPSTPSPPTHTTTATTTTTTASTSFSFNAPAYPPPPRLFGSNFLSPHRPHPNWALPATPQDQLPMLRVSGGFSSLFALYIAGATPIATPASQQYVLRTLERVAAEFGINQAKVLARALVVKIGLDRVENVGPRGYGTMRKEGAWDVVPVYLPPVGPHLEEQVVEVEGVGG